MKATRLISIPIAHVTAEAAAFPLASVSALCLATDCLDPSLKNGTAELWREAEQAIARSLPGFSIDEAVAIRDKIWFGRDNMRFGENPDSPTSLHTFLCRLAQAHLELHGTVATPAIEEVEKDSIYGTPHFPEAVARWRWRWLSLALPPDLLLAALSLKEGLMKGGPPSHVDNVSTLIVHQLEDGKFTESHLHLGAAMEFPVTWVLLLHALADTEMRTQLFESPGAELEEGRMLGPWLIRAATVRYLLAAYLSPSTQRQGLDRYIDQVVRECLYASQAGATSFELLVEGIRQLLNPKSLPDDERENKRSFAIWQMIYKRLTGLPRLSLPETRKELMETDPIAQHLPSFHSDQAAETRFLVFGLNYLKYLEQPYRKDPLFSKLFWQVVRIRSLVYRHMVQRPMTPGLQWFVRFYSRLSPARQRASYQLRRRLAAEICGEDCGLLSLEVRTSPESSVSRMWKELKDMDNSLVRTFPEDSVSYKSTKLKNMDNSLGGRERLGHDHKELEFGVIYHFSKDRGGKALEGRPQAYWRSSHADPEFNLNPRDPSYPNPSGYRYARYYNAKERETLALVWILRNLPATVELVRGVDICTDEMGVPFWVLAPLLRAVRRAGDEAVRCIQAKCGFEIPPLRTTIHAGEDFVHLLTGLRHIDEAINLFGLREGDRLGHAIALGIDARDWAVRAGQIAIPREVRLFDLAWEWGWYQHCGVGVPKRRRALLESEIVRLTERIFDVRYDIYDIIGLRKALYRGTDLWWAGFPNGPLPLLEAEENKGQNWRAADLLIRYLTSPKAFCQGQVIEWIDPECEGDPLAEIQRGIRSVINNRGFTIEVNPSSNLLIGDLGDLGQHPLWRLNPPNGEGEGPALPVCVGSDDPLTFATSLPYEYQLVYDALILSGVSGENAHKWLRNAQQRGRETRFTVPRRELHDLLHLRNITGSQTPILLDTDLAELME